MPFYFFMRAGKDNEGYGGAALANSFLLFAPEAGTAPKADPPRLVIAHEMTHHFAGVLSAPDGIEGSWFGEGLAEYYSRWITFRAGLITPSEFSKAINGAAQSYFTNPLKNLPNEKIAEGFWRDKNVQGLPYQRGFFYFVDTNQKLLAASQGKVSVDTVVLSVLKRRNDGEELTPQMWKQAVEKELGPAGAEEFEGVIFRGDLVVPASDAFGPCFERKTLQMGVFDLGFDQHKTLDAHPRVVQGLVSGSPADRAGLHNGDAILAVDPLNLDEIRSDVSKQIRLKIKRGEQALEIEYLPRGQAVEGYEWVRRASVPDDACVAHP
jgi:predicted metalloprotease with PDZ domain